MVDRAVLHSINAIAMTNAESGTDVFTIHNEFDQEESL